MRDGDVYFWTWLSQKDFMPYHCWAGKAIVKDGQLRDTFWSTEQKVLKMQDVDAQYQGNIHDMTEIREHEISYYRSEDVVDMRHSNSTRAKIYIKPGVARNADAMREHINYRIECAESTIRSQQSLIERLAEAKSAIDAGNLDDVYL